MRISFHFNQMSDNDNDGDRPHLLGLVFVGRVLFMFVIEKLKIFSGRLLCADDHSEFKVVSGCSLMLRKKTLVKKGGL